jgi:hypothetical protein
MSKQGRTSVLLTALVSTLLISPLVYLALAGKTNPIDQAALNNRIAMLRATAVEGPTGLRARYRMVRLGALPVLPPNPAMKIGLTTR